MKKILFASIILAVTAIGCDCKHGYGPDDCKETWASNYVGTWQGTTSCSNGGQTGQSTITEETATSIRIDGQILATLNDWNSFSIPTQEINGAIINGQGGIREERNTNPQGGLIEINQTLWFEFTATQNGQSGYCSSEFSM
jgi:hypothetical protein